MLSEDQLGLLVQFDGLAASMKVMVNEMASQSPDAQQFRQRMALAAAADIRQKTKSPDMEAKRNLMMVWVARTFDVPVGLLMEN